MLRPRLLVGLLLSAICFTRPAAAEEEPTTPNPKRPFLNAYLGVAGAAAAETRPMGGLYFGFTGTRGPWSGIVDLRLMDDAIGAVLLSPVSLMTLGLFCPEINHGMASLSAGARYHASTSGIGPFLGGGFGYTHLSILRGGGSLEKTALSGYLESGIDILETRHAGVTLLARVDMLAAPLVGTTFSNGSRERTREWVPMGTMAVSIRF